MVDHGKPDGHESKGALRQRLMARSAELATGGVGRLWRTGRTSASLARALSRAASSGEVDAAALEGIVTALGEMKGLAMKLGQMVSYLDPTLPEELRVTLAALQTAASATPFPAVKSQIERGLGADRARELVAAMDPAPLAVASIGQVHRASLSDGTPVAVKVLHPGIVEAIGNELLVAGRGAAVADVILGNVNGFVAEAKATLLAECDYALEAENQRALRQAFATDPVIVVPEVMDAWCASNVLVTRYRPGRPLDEVRDDTRLRDAIGAALYRFHLGGLYRSGLFHADPHPGNYAVDDDGHLVVYDFGCVREFDRTSVTALVALAGAARADDVSAMRVALAALGGIPPRDEAGSRELRRFVRGFFAPMLALGPTQIAPDSALDAKQVIRDKRALHRLKLPPQMLFLFRLRFGLYAVLSRLGAVNDWGEIERALATEARARHP